MAQNLKLKIVICSNDNSDEKESKITCNIDLDLPLEKLNLGSKKKLLVLNLGGLLVDRVNRYRREASVVRKFTPDLVNGNFLVFKRPYCEQFMKFCLERFEVGLWSSAMDYNVDPILDSIMVGLRKKLVFVWGQDECVDSGFPTLKNKYKPIFLKQLKKIWESNYLPFRGGKYSEANTLMIDSDPYVALINPPNTAVFPPEYKVGNGNDNFLGAKGEMQKFLKGLVDANNVQTYVKEHPFGEPAISESHPNWDYYAKIVGVVNSPYFSEFDSDYSD